MLWLKSVLSVIQGDARKRKLRRLIAVGDLAREGVSLEARQMLTPVGLDGWSVLQVSQDSRVIYVSSSGGDDSNSGMSADAPVRTIGKAFTLVRDDYPDWVVLKRGDVFNEGRVSWYRGGRSETEPMVITGYGTGDRPVLLTTSLVYYGPNGGPNMTLDHLALVGLSFEADWNNNQEDLNHYNAILFAGGANDLLVEDCSFTGYRTLVSIQYVAGGQPVSDIRIRRNELLDGVSQGLFVSNATGVVIEENIMDRNGWKDGEANKFRHNVYLFQITDLQIRGNIFSRGGNFGTKLSSDTPGGFSNFVVENNLYINNGLGLDHSSGPIDDVYTTFTHENGIIRNNVFTELGRTFSDGSKQDLVGWLLNSKDLTWEGNVFVHKAPFHMGAILIWAGHHQNVLIKDSIVSSWAKNDGEEYLTSRATENVDLLTVENNLVDLPLNEYVAPERSVGTYNTSIGGEGGYTAFILAARQLDKSVWNSALTADAVNDYIRAGFARKLTAPVFTTPANMRTTSPRPTIEWNPVDGADGYEVWYTNLSTGQNPVRVDSASSNSSSPGADLPIGRYRIWVRATQEYGAPSPWSAFVTVHVSTPPAVSMLSDDPKNARPALTWEPVPGAVRYEVWGDNLTTKASKVFHSANLTTASYTPSSDLGFAHYRFWVRAFDASGVPGNWSPAVDYSRVSVSTEFERIAFDGLNGPSLFEWDPLPGSVRYEFWGDNVTTGTRKAIYESGVTGASFVPAIDVPFGQYRVWVRGFDQLGIPSAWSPVAIAVNSPLPVSPIQPTFERRPTFSWGDITGVGSYELYINSNGTILNPAGIVDNSWTPAVDLPVGNLSWWVRPWGLNGAAGLWSAKATAYIGGKSELLTADRLSSSFPASVSLTWKAVIGAERYILHVERIGFGVVIREDALTTASFISSATLAAGQYRAWIRAIDGRDNVSGIWSDMFVFTLAASDVFESDVFDQADLLTQKLTPDSRLVHSDSHRLSRSRLEMQPAATTRAAGTDQEIIGEMGSETRDVSFDSNDDGFGLGDEDHEWPARRSDGIMTEEDADLIDQVLSDRLAVTAGDWNI